MFTSRSKVQTVMTQKERLEWERRFAKAPDRLKLTPCIAVVSVFLLQLASFSRICLLVTCAWMCFNKQLCNNPSTNA